MKKIAIIGATSTIANHCARLWAEQDAWHFVLTGRNQDKLKIIASDLLVRSPNSTVDIIVANLADLNAIEETCKKISEGKPPTLALIAHGTLFPQDDCANNLNTSALSMLTNGVTPCLYAEALSRSMATIPKSTLIMIGSVAGDRGRKTNYTYGAAKGLMDVFSQGLQHKYFQSSPHICLVKPGPTATAMTKNLELNEKALAKPHDVAQQIVSQCHKKSTIYTPRKWWLIMAIIKNLPKAIFLRLNI
ncbi:SDR family NAD(P)-dependent oxidoreductase [Simiduia agarivorans]|uniref:Short-chain dehydrogenase/reductase SDR n=1 Tax=Simiduia agarivorans (strain DSM 21679 / JCM 13881 / BCRC 17597 / SA1) TaxID=1117647 RepID=K4KRF1_SIMAS|nr:SDR family NAD(P)-dependent oxidoreductase [Simiduia agarivorans]AFV00709.1 short-chain dehydrogenase/reductase SDR [Simiduia agarivorans SA1 = DSM 21679]